MGQAGSMAGFRGAVSNFWPKLKPPIGGGGGGPLPGGGGGGGGPAPGRPGGGGGGGGGGGPPPGRGGGGGGGGGATMLPSKGGGGGGGGPERPAGGRGGGGGGGPEGPGAISVFRFSPIVSRLSFLGMFRVGLGAFPLLFPSGLLTKVSLSVWMPTVRQVLMFGLSAVDTATSQTSGLFWPVLYSPSLCISAITSSRCDMATAFSPRSSKIRSSKSDCEVREQNARQNRFKVVSMIYNNNNSIC